MSDKHTACGFLAALAFVISQLDIIGLFYEFIDVVGSLANEFIFTMKAEYPELSGVIAPATFIFVVILVLYLVRE